MDLDIIEDVERLKAYVANEAEDDSLEEPGSEPAEEPATEEPTDTETDTDEPTDEPETPAASSAEAWLADIWAGTESQVAEISDDAKKASEAAAAWRKEAISALDALKVPLNQAELESGKPVADQDAATLGNVLRLAATVNTAILALAHAIKELGEEGPEE